MGPSAAKAMAAESWIRRIPDENKRERTAEMYDLMERIEYAHLKRIMIGLFAGAIITMGGLAMFTAQEPNAMGVLGLIFWWALAWLGVDIASKTSHRSRVDGLLAAAAGHLDRNQAYYQALDLAVDARPEYRKLAARIRQAKAELDQQRSMLNPQAS